MTQITQEQERYIIVHGNDLGEQSINYLMAELSGTSVVWQGTAFTIFTKDPEDEQVLWDPVNDKMQAVIYVEQNGFDVTTVESAKYGFESFGDVGLEAFSSHGPTERLSRMRCLAIMHRQTDPEFHIPEDIAKYDELALQQINNMKRKP